MTYLKTDGSPGATGFLGRAVGYRGRGRVSVVRVAPVIGQRPGSPVEHEPSFQPLSAPFAAGRGTRQLLQVAAARRAVDPKAFVVSRPVAVQLVSGGLDVRAQVERDRAISVAPHGQVPGKGSLENGDGGNIINSRLKIKKIIPPSRVRKRQP